MMRLTRVQVLDWDSQWFGFPIGRVDVEVLTPAAAVEVDAWASAQGLRCVYVYADRPCEFPLAGFEPMDVRVEYEIDPVPLATGAEEETEPLRPMELESVCEMARHSFTGTRFFRDKRFPLGRVRELYAEWVRKDIVHGNPGCLVARKSGELAGFVTGRLDSKDATTGVIGLIGVAEGHRGCGLGKRLLGAVCRAFVVAGTKRMRVVTQETNGAACHLYEGAGGRVVSRGYWIHRWLDETVSRRIGNT